MHEGRLIFAQIMDYLPREVFDDCVRRHAGYYNNKGFTCRDQFLANLGVWMDKFLVWYSPYGTEVLGWFDCAISYDACLFFSYLTVIPAMALFLIRIETSFDRNYSVYLMGIGLDRLEFETFAKQVEVG